MVRRALPVTHASTHATALVTKHAIRTCVGCRKRAPASELLRVVAVSRTSSETGEPTGVFDLVPDPTRIKPGRGAHLHFDPVCLAQAVRRRLFGRALRVSGVTDAGAVERELAADVLNGTTDGEATKSAPGKQGRTTHMSTR